MVGLIPGAAEYSPSPQHLETTGYTGTHFFWTKSFSSDNKSVTHTVHSVIQLGVTSALSPSLNIFMPSVSWPQPVKQLHRRLRTINSQLFWTAWDVSHLTQWLVEETDKWFFIGGWSVYDSLSWHFRCQEVQILAWYLCTFSPYGFGSSCKEKCFSPYGSYLEFSVSSLIRNWKSVGVIYISICHCCYCLLDNHIQMLMSN